MSLLGFAELLPNGLPPPCLIEEPPHEVAGVRTESVGVVAVELAPGVHRLFRFRLAFAGVIGRTGSGSSSRPGATGGIQITSPSGLVPNALQSGLPLPNLILRCSGLGNGGTCVICSADSASGPCARSTVSDKT